MTSLLRLSFVTSPLLTASYIGRNFAPVYLSAFSIANLAVNLSTFTLLAGLMTAFDNLSPQAYWKIQFDEIGKITIRSFCVCNLLLVPVNVVLFFIWRHSWPIIYDKMRKYPNMLINGIKFVALVSYSVSLNFSFIFGSFWVSGFITLLLLLVYL